MARTPGSGAGQRGVRRGHRGVDGELLQRDAQVYRFMRFQLIGVNHRTAPVEVRERLAIPESRLPDACNRVEFLANMKNGSGDLRAFMRDYFAVDMSQFESHLYEFREDEAIRHVFRVASSLDSMIVGEPQILGQIK